MLLYSLDCWNYSINHIRTSLKPEQSIVGINQDSYFEEGPIISVVRCLIAFMFHQLTKSSIYLTIY